MDCCTCWGCNDRRSMHSKSTNEWITLALGSSGRCAGASSDSPTRPKSPAVPQIQPVVDCREGAKGRAKRIPQDLASCTTSYGMEHGSLRGKGFGRGAGRGERLEPLSFLDTSDATSVRPPPPANPCHACVSTEQRAPSLARHTTRT